MPSCPSQKRGTARDSTGFGRPACSTILRGTGGLFFSIVKKILTKTFSLFFPLFYQVPFLRYCFWKHCRPALNSDMHKPGLKDLCATRWWPENPVSIWGYSGRQRFHPWVTYSFPTFQDEFPATLHCLSMFLLPVTLGVGSKLVPGQVRLEVFLLLWLVFKKEFC